MKTSTVPATIPGIVSGTVTRQNDAVLPGSQVRRGFEQRAVQLLERGVEGEDHERQLAIDEADHHRRLGVQDLQGMVEQAGAQEDQVDQPLRAQNEHPGIGTDEEARPERHHHQPEKQPLPPPGRQDRQVVGDGEAHAEAEDGRQHGHPERPPADLEIDRSQGAGVVAQELPRDDVGAQVRHRLDAAVGAPLGEADRQHEPEGNEEEDPQHQPRGQEEGVGGAAGFAHLRFL